MNFSDVENAAVPDLKKCVGCEREITLANLKDENQANVQAHVDEMKAEIVSDVKKQITDMFKGAGFKLK